MTKKERIGLFIILLSIIGLAVSSMSFDYEELGQVYKGVEKEEETPNTVKEEKILDTSHKTAYLEIDSKRYEVDVQNGESVYSFMDRLKEKGTIQFKYKTYTGLGKFIDEINGIRGNGEKYWIYYVNGEKAKIGVSEYKLKPGDVVSWKYENDLSN